MLVVEHASDAAPFPDGSAVLVAMDSPSLGDTDIARCALEAGAQPVALLHSPFTEDQPAVSPGGRWFAYRSNETGRDEVFLQSLSEPGTKGQVSIDGGAYPMWGPRGETLSFLHGDAWMEVRLTPGEDARPGRPQRVLAAADVGLTIGDGSQGLVGLGLSPDGERLLVGRRSQADPRAGILYFHGFEPQAR